MLTMANATGSALKRKLFGTDGIRGKANVPPMTPELVLRIGRAAGMALRSGDHRHTVVIGKDTRLSGYMFEAALQTGFTSVGLNCLLVGPMPTPAIAYLTRAFRADAGVMISASHNPYYDNGIKFFGPNGMKLPDSMEAEIERLLAKDADEGTERFAPSPGHIGRANRITGADGRYIEFCKTSFPKELRLDGIRIVADCAHGAAYRVAPKLLWELGAEVIAIGDAPNGLNINEGSGSLYPEQLRQKVKEVRADIGVAFDGDADRLVVCDEKGRILDGDAILAMSALDLKKRKKLKGGGVVATVMSNLGLERFLGHHGLNLVRTQVGDRYVLEHMIKHGYNLGGEQSGHLLFLDHNTTGDGIVSALQVLSLMAASGRPLSELTAGMETVPQILKNVLLPSSDVAPLEVKSVQKAIQSAEKSLSGSGRLLIRKSGTEPKIRVMAEGDDERQIRTVVDELCHVIKKAAS